eukprot:1929079-Alexandrium_andersonii.AAC.1
MHSSPSPLRVRSTPSRCRQLSSCCDAPPAARARPAVRAVSLGLLGGPRVRKAQRVRARGVRVVAAR